MLPPTDVRQLTEALVRVPSPTGEEVEVARLVEEKLGEWGLRVRRQDVDGRRFNLLATTDGPPRVLLCTHLDVVLPLVPFAEKDGVLYGRGVCDAKGAMSAMLVAARRLLQSGERRFGLLFVVGEERDSDGARRAARLDIGSRAVVIGEPTEGKLVSAQKGTLVFRLRMSGVAGHSAVPESGVSAVHALVRLLDGWLRTDWGQDPRLGETTLNLGVLQGGTGSNVIAAEATVEGIFRIAISVESVLDRLRSTLPDGAFFEVISSSEPLRLSTVEGFAQTVVSFGSDAPYLRPLGDVLMIGPGSIRHAHREDEQVRVEELEQAARDYERLVRTLNQRWDLEAG